MRAEDYRNMKQKSQLCQLKDKATGTVVGFQLSDDYNILREAAVYLEDAPTNNHAFH